MNGNWAESTDRIVKLPEDRVEIFETHLNLVYTGNPQHSYLVLLYRLLSTHFLYLNKDIR
ncbi:hypothetical protein DM02DRAFT_612314 [Periconia macrospinosa]|uniref:BTB domain-containing protein n=1 Tax=Periconia macrospinosa TaxID=97972 RepID=A0A2V1E1R3_9PLEO|nr:hypothetical protein DM02DRAFT_612314 [Periconia macrospinosa]